MDFLKRFRRGSDQQPEAKTLDQMTIAHVAARAADMSAPRDANFYLYLPNEKDARAVAAAVARPGRKVITRPAATGTSWLVLVNEAIVVSKRSIEDADREFSAAVAPYGGEYDGWEAAAT